MSSLDQRLATLDEESGINIKKFKEILEMDDNEDSREYTRSLYVSFFEQVDSNTSQMNEALGEGGVGLPKVTELCRYLKAAAKTLGLDKINQDCGGMEFTSLGQNSKGEPAEPTPTTEKIVNWLDADIMMLKAYCDRDRAALEKFYGTTL